MSDHSFLLGLIGRNILGSLSPALHEDALAALGRRGHYHLMDLDVLTGRRLPDLIAAIRAAGFAGINVTYPCKEEVIPLLDDVTREARQIGAVNTVTVDPSGRLLGHNTDRIGFRRGFEEAFGGAAIAGKTAALIGAGGAGRAVAFALLDLGAACLLVHDTDKGRAAALAANLVQHCGPQRARLVDNLDVDLPAACGLVNATPLGMRGFSGNPIAPHLIRAHHWIADVIYTPLETELLALARAKGCRTMNGGGMSVHQAVAAFHLWTGLNADPERVRATFAKAAAARDAAFAKAQEPARAG